MLSMQLTINQLADEQLLIRGFVKDELSNQWRMCKELSVAGLELRIVIVGKTLNYQVYDTNFDDLWLPFYQKNNDMHIVNEVENILKQFMPINDNIYDKMIAMIKEQCNDVILEKPWENTSNFTTFKVGKNQKWFALYMDIEASKLGLTHAMLIDVLNIKLSPEIIEQLIDYRVYFPAYHMNKKHWLSIYLNQVTDNEILSSLIKKSYNLVKEHSK